MVCRRCGRKLLGYDQSYKHGLCPSCRKIYVEELEDTEFSSSDSSQSTDNSKAHSDSSRISDNNKNSDTSRTETVNYSSYKSSRSNTPIYVIAGIVAGLIVIVAGFLFSNAKKQDAMMKEVAARNQISSSSNSIPAPNMGNIPNVSTDYSGEAKSSSKPEAKENNTDEFDANADGLNGEIEVYSEDALSEDAQAEVDGSPEEDDEFRYILGANNVLKGGPISFPVPSFFFEHGRKGKNDYTFVAVDDGDGQELTEKESAVGLIFDSEKMDIKDSDAKSLLKRMTGSNAKVTDWNNITVAGFPAVEISFSDNNGQNDIIGKGVCVTDSNTGITYMIMVFYCDKIGYDYTKDFDAMIKAAY